MEKDRSSAVAAHLLVSEHRRDLVQIKLVHEATKDSLMNKLEELAVVDASQNVNVTLLNRIFFTAFNSFISLIYKPYILSSTIPLSPFSHHLKST